MLSRLVGNAIFWLNAFPHADGVSTTLSPRYLLTGKHIDYHKHVRLEFGAYVQTHEKHTNDMEARTTGAICLGPSGNDQGGHYFMSLATGQRLHRHRWTALPLPDDARTRVSNIGREQGMPSSLTFADRFGTLIPDTLNDIDDRSLASSNDSSYRHDDHGDDDVSYNSMSYDDSSASGSLGSDQSQDDLSNDKLEQVDSKNNNMDHRYDDDDVNDTNEDIKGDPDGSMRNDSDDDESTNDKDCSDGDDDDDDDNNHDDDMDDDDSGSDDDDALVANTNNTRPNDKITGVDANNSTEAGAMVDANDNEMDIKYGPRTHDINLRPRKQRNYSHRYDH
jgi:hypothetical protein